MSENVLRREVTNTDHPASIRELFGQAADVVDAAIRLRDEFHHVTFRATGWELEHNLPCRVAGMFKCEIHQRLREMTGPPSTGLNRYAVTLRQDGELAFHVHQGQDDAAALLRALERIEGAA